MDRMVLPPSVDTKRGIQKGGQSVNRWMLTLWRMGDVVYRRWRSFDYDDRRGNNVFRLTIKPYRGPDLRIGEQWLRRGDLVGELHLYNYRLQQMLQGISSEIQLGLVALREVRNSLPPLADYLDLHPAGYHVKALVGVSILHRGAASIGFHVFDLEAGWRKHFKTSYMRWLMRLCHPAGAKRFSGKGNLLIPKRIVMMKDVFALRYGQKSICMTN